MTIIDHEGIENEAKFHELAAVIDNDFFTESIREQIFDGLDCTNKDYLKEFNVKLKYIVENYAEDEYASILESRDELYRNIITWFEEKHNIEISYDSDELVRIVNQLYKFFIIDIKEAITSFLFYYIRENYESILQSIDEERLNTSQVKDTTDPETKSAVLLMTNLGTVLDTVFSMDISFDTFITYAAKGDGLRSVTEIYNAIESVDEDSPSILSIQSEDGVFTSMMQEMKDNTYDHNIVVELSSMLLESLNIQKGEIDND